MGSAVPRVIQATPPGQEQMKATPPGQEQMKNSLNMKKINSLNLLTYYNMLIQIYKS